MFFEKEFTHFTYEAQGISLSFFLINAYSPTHSLHKQQTGPPTCPLPQVSTHLHPWQLCSSLWPLPAVTDFPSTGSPCSLQHYLLGELEKRRLSGQCIMLSRDLRHHFMFPHRRAAQFHLFPLNDRVRCHLFQDTHS